MSTADETLRAECEIMDRIAPTYRQRRDIAGPAYRRCRDEFSHWVLEDLGRSATPLQDLTILDAGCGTGEIAERLLAAGCRDVIACDAASAMLRQCQQQVPGALPLQADLAVAPLKPKSIDAICAAFTAHHMHNPGDLFETAARVLKPGGALYLLEYNTDGAGFNAPWNHVVRILTAPTRLAWTAKNRMEAEPPTGFNPSHRLRSIEDYRAYAGKEWRCTSATSQLLLTWHNDCLLPNRASDRWMIQAITRLDRLLMRRLTGVFAFLRFQRS